MNPQDPIKTKNGRSNELGIKRVSAALAHSSSRSPIILYALLKGEHVWRVSTRDINQEERSPVSGMEWPYEIQ